MKTAVVTGGASGIGCAIAQRLRSDGFQVAVIDLVGKTEQAEAAKAKVGFQACRQARGTTKIAPVS